MDGIIVNTGRTAQERRYGMVAKSITLPDALMVLIEKDKDEFMTENISEIIRLRLLYAYRQAGKLQ
jgi:hypothetical protein